MGKSAGVIISSLLLLTLVLARAEHGASARAPASISAVVSTAQMRRPNYLEPVIDPAFGTPFLRVTDPGTIRCRNSYCTHRYSSSQAWNADQSLLAIVNGCNGFCFLDGHTYEPLFRRSVPNECEWHPQVASSMICVAGNEIYNWAPHGDTKTALYVAAGYVNLQFGPYKGNPSADGSKIVVRATSKAGTLVAFAYDISRRIKYPDIDLSALPGKNGYCSISPSGRYIFCAQTTESGNEEAHVFTIEGGPIQYWTEHHRPGHGDMTIDADGSDVYVGISKAEPDKFHVIKRRLNDGSVVDLAPYGNAQHVSTRNTSLPGWAFVSYAGTYEETAAHPSWAPFYQEVVALRIDGSGTIRRIAQTRNQKHDYWSETHASPSPDATQVIWSSNWGKAGGPVADYVTRLSRPNFAGQPQ